MFPLCRHTNIALNGDGTDDDDYSSFSKTFIAVYVPEVA